MNQVEASIDRLQDVLFTSTDDITPLALIQPPSERPSREDALRQRYMQLGIQHLHLRKIEEKLMKLRRHVFRQQTLCTDALAPISALPHEIICRILRYAASHEYPSVRELARVNREWRNAALHDPQLWSHLAVPGDRFIQIASSMARGPLSYTPLHLSVKDRDAIRLPHYLVKSLQSRLVTARFSSSDGPAILGALNRALKYHPEGLSALESLSIDLPALCASCDFANPQARGQLLQLDDIALPKLEALELQRCIVKLNSCSLLTSLALSDVVTQAHDVHQLLSHSPSIISVSFSGVLIRGTPFQGTRVSLLKLETLQISSTSPFSAAQFLAIIHGPNMRTFSLTHIEPPQEDIPRDFEQGELSIETRLFVEFRMLVSRISINPVPRPGIDFPRNHRLNPLGISRLSTFPLPSTVPKHSSGLFFHGKKEALCTSPEAVPHFPISSTSSSDATPPNSRSHPQFISPCSALLYRRLRVLWRRGGPSDTPYCDV